MNKKFLLPFRGNNIYPLIIAVLLLTLQLQVFSQNTKSKITGKVTDATTGQSLVGVSVSVKGTSHAAITDADGAYSILVNEDEKILVFSFIGMKKQEFSIDGRSIINVLMDTEFRDLNEVVVVGYGTQKKTTLTGSVFQVKGDEVLQGKATTSIAASLQGIIPGLTITRTSSRPGNEGINITLRGGISVNTIDPMIVIDGIDSYQWELSQINPNDIENVSVLRDAAASIYGTRAAGGVILVTTKRGKDGKVKVSYSGSSHMNYLGHRFPVASGQEWAQMNIEAVNNDAVASGAPSWWLFTGDEYARLAKNEAFMRSNGTLRLDPTSNQFDAVYGNTFGQEHNVSISGGTDKLRIFSSFGYAKDRSLVKVVFDGTQKYNFRTNLDYTISPWIKAEANVSYDKRTISTPTIGVGEGIQDMFIFPLYNPKGQYYDAFGSNNMLAKLNEGGRTNNTESFFRLGGKLTFDMGFIQPLKGLSFSANANIKERKQWMVQRGTTVTMYDWAGELGKPNNIFFQTAPSNLYAADRYANNSYQSYGVFGNYTKKINNHHLAIMAGMTEETDQYTDLYGKRTFMAADNLDALNTGNATNATNSGNAWAWGLVSYLGRLNYDYNETYLLEAQFRRDGSSKLAIENRWADFAGLSAGIRLTQYDFIKNLNIFDNLKIKASYGETGSLALIGNYDYISPIGTGTTVFGTTPVQTQTAWVSRLTSRDRSWERVGTTNFGIEYTVLKNRLSGTVDYFIRKNKGMMINVIYPSVLGAQAPPSNDGFFTAKGFELALQWKDKVGDDFNYHVGATLADSRTKVTKYPGLILINSGNNYMIQGKPLNSIYVYRTAGYLQNEAEVTSYYAAESGPGTRLPVNAPGSRLIPGCVNKIDISKDGAITTADLSYYGDANPHYTYGINLGASYKGFDFNAFLQGVGQQYIVRTDAMSAPFRWVWMNENRTFLGNTWSATNTNAKYPVMSQNGNRNTWNYADVNDINVTNASYMRVKSLILGYTLPNKLAVKAGLGSVRLWLSGDNLFELSNIKDGFDPESKTSTGQGNVDVYSRTVSLGVDITF